MSAVEPAPADLTEDEARAFVHHVRASVEEIGNWIVRAVKGRAWLALGYPSWDAMCESEFDGAVVRLPREDRREAVASLREAGLSTRAIAGALGVDAKTVRNDAASTGEKSPVDRVSSLDGRDRPASRPLSARTLQLVDTGTGEIRQARTYRVLPPEPGGLRDQLEAARQPPAAEQQSDRDRQTSREVASKNIARCVWLLAGFAMEADGPARTAADWQPSQDIYPEPTTAERMRAAAQYLNDLADRWPI